MYNSSINRSLVQPSMSSAADMAADIISSTRATSCSVPLDVQPSFHCIYDVENFLNHMDFCHAIG
jgi:hypothetical protein